MPQHPRNPRDQEPHAAADTRVQSVLRHLHLSDLFAGEGLPADAAAGENSRHGPRPTAHRQPDLPGKEPTAAGRELHGAGSSGAGPSPSRLRRASSNPGQRPYFLRGWLLGAGVGGLAASLRRPLVPQLSELCQVGPALHGRVREQCHGHGRSTRQSGRGLRLHRARRAPEKWRSTHSLPSVLAVPPPVHAPLGDRGAGQRGLLGSSQEVQGLRPTTPTSGAPCTTIRQSSRRSAIPWKWNGPSTGTPSSCSVDPVLKGIPGSLRSAGTTTLDHRTKWRNKQQKQAVRHWPFWTLYGSRGCNPRVHELSAYEFAMHFEFKKTTHPCNIKSHDDKEQHRPVTKLK